MAVPPEENQHQSLGKLALRKCAQKKHHATDVYMSKVVFMYDLC